MLRKISRQLYSGLWQVRRNLSAGGVKAKMEVLNPDKYLNNKEVQVVLQIRFERSSGAGMLANPSE
jgi:hypothetical protein